MAATPAEFLPAQIFPAYQPPPGRLYHGHRRKSFRLKESTDLEELVELRARQRTFDGAYMRAALGNFGYALIILKVFNPEFAKIGLLYVILAVLLLLVSFVRRRRSDHDFADIYRPIARIVSNGGSKLKQGPKIWGRDFRTSGDVVIVVGLVVTGLYTALFVLIMKLE